MTTAFDTVASLPAFPAYAVAASVVATQLVALALHTGTVRAIRKVFTNPEDAALNKAKLGDHEHADVARVQRAHANLIENALPFLIVGFLYVLTGGSRTGALAYMGTFVAARLLHSVFYLAGKQPFRTITFAVGVLAILGMALHVVRTVV